jgi:hypothetical protein
VLTVSNLPHSHPSSIIICDAGKYSVPVLWDKKEGVIVNNESGGSFSLSVLPNGDKVDCGTATALLCRLL